MPAPPIIIYLWGFMGSGKSFLGKQLASIMALPVIDLDIHIEKTFNSSITRIFETKGEVYFRELETKALIECSNLLLSGDFKTHNGKNYYGIISCGGGTPLVELNRQIMQRNGLTIWLNPPVTTLINRLTDETSQRPLIANLKGAALQRFIEDKLAIRKQCYMKADLEISPAESTDEILNQIE